MPDQSSPQFFKVVSLRFIL